MNPPQPTSFATAAEISAAAEVLANELKDSCPFTFDEPDGWYDVATRALAAAAAERGVLPGEPPEARERGPNGA